MNEEIEPTSSETPLPFFVYGTLLPAQPNAYLWQGKVSQVSPAILPHGWLYDMGAFPLLRLGKPGEGQLAGQQAGRQIEGALLVAKNEEYAELLAQIDALEGYFPDDIANSEYRRLQTEVILTDGSPIQAWVYEGNASRIAGMPPLQISSWAAYADQKYDAMQQWWDNFHGLFPE